MRTHHIMEPDTEGRVLNVLGETVRICGQGDSTKRFEVHLQQGQKGGGPPPHRHPWDEAFYVLDGSVRLTVAGETMDAHQGTLVHIPADTVHAYENLSESATLLAVVSDTRGGEVFEAFDHSVKQLPADLPKVLEIGSHHGVEFLLDD